MKKCLLALVLVGAVLAGCGGGSLKDKIVGTWKVDTASVKMPDMPDAVKNDPRFKTALDEQMKKLGEGRLEFKADGTAVPTNMGSQKGGKWSVKDNELILEDEKGVSKDVKATVEAD